MNHWLQLIVKPVKLGVRREAVVKAISLRQKVRGCLSAHKRHSRDHVALALDECPHRVRQCLAKLVHMQSIKIDKTERPFRYYL